MTKEEFFEGFDLSDPKIVEELEWDWNNRIAPEELERGIFGVGKDPFEGIRTNKTFQEISNEVAMSTPFGKESVFYRELREIIKGQIPKL